MHIGFCYLSVTFPTLSTNKIQEKTSLSSLQMRILSRETRLSSRDTRGSRQEAVTWFCAVLYIFHLRPLLRFKIMLVSHWKQTIINVELTSLFHTLSLGLSVQSLDTQRALRKMNKMSVREHPLCYGTGRWNVRLSGKWVVCAVIF